MTQLLVLLYLGLFAALVFGAVAGLRLRCEGFGCMGQGIYWFAWSCVYGVAGLMGFWARARSLHAAWGARWVRGAMWLQLLIGLALLVRWWT